MKKLFTAIGTTLGLISAPVVSAQVTNTAFESALYASKKTGELLPVWEHFVNTQFFVVVVRNGSGAKTKVFRFSVFNNPVDKKPAVKSNFQRLQEAKQRNAQVVAAYKSAQNSVSFNQQQITDLRAKLDKETGRLNNEKARNGELKRRLKQLKAGN